ncbi:MAG: winged helix-turn-helix domain-containing protein [Limisphaerales bacterium]
MFPEFNEIKAPAIQFFADGKLHRLAEVFETLAKHFNLTEAEQNELLPSGTQRRWHNRANWACYDLFRAGLLDRPKKGTYVITELGKKIAKENPAAIDRDYLMKFPAFAEFVQTANADKGGAKDATRQSEITSADKSATPQEIIESAYKAIQMNVKSELLGLVKRMDPYQFEQLVVDLLVAMGYGGSREEAARVTKASNDEGIDGVINEDRLVWMLFIFKQNDGNTVLGGRKFKALLAHWLDNKHTRESSSRRANLLKQLKSTRKTYRKKLS